MGEHVTDEERAAFKRSEHERVRPSFLDRRWEEMVRRLDESHDALTSVRGAKAFNMLPRAVQDRVRAALGETKRG